MKTFSTQTVAIIALTIAAVAIIGGAALEKILGVM